MAGETPLGPLPWPYPVEYDKTDYQDADVLVIGGGASGCFAAMGAASRGARVVMWEKAATMTSGAMGSGCDHWEMAATNPCSLVTPEELADAMVRMHHGYNNGISHYIEAREGYDRLLDLEKYGAKIRDTDDEFKGADFRDDATKFMFAYDYVNRFTLRVWGTTFKRAMYRGAKILKANVVDRTMGAGLLTEGGKVGGRVVGAVAINGRTGKFTVCRAKSVVFCMSRPTRLWLFAPGATGISEFRPPQCTGDGHAMAWRVGGQFTMLEKSLRGEWSGLRSFPPYSTGNNHNTWYACTMVDADGRRIPWLDRDGRELPQVGDRYRPSPGQKFYMKGGGEPDFPFYEFQGPETLAVDEAVKRGFKLPFYADLTDMPPMERKVIWGMMVGNEGKTKTPVYAEYNNKGFDPATHVLQSYGDGWRSGQFLPQERQFFGIPGGMVNDWRLMTNLEGLFAAGDVLFASDCVGPRRRHRSLRRPPGGAVCRDARRGGRVRRPGGERTRAALRAAAAQPRRDLAGPGRSHHPRDAELLRRGEERRPAARGPARHRGAARQRGQPSRGEESARPAARAGNPQRAHERGARHPLVPGPQGQLEAAHVPAPRLSGHGSARVAPVRDRAARRRGRARGVAADRLLRRLRHKLRKAQRRLHPRRSGAMSDPKVFAIADQAIVDPITIVPELCTGCNLCLHVCPVDLFLPNHDKGGPPHVLYPGECWYEGSCVDVCPEPGAIRLNRPPAMRVNWKPRAARRP